MRVKKILLTGDDGYKAIGTRLVAAVLKDAFELKIAATKEQRSAIGGGVTNGGTWGKNEVEGVETLWVSGTPADAMECAEVVFGKDFDLVISGLNWGVNVGAANASGTVGAALRALARGTTPKAMALSWLTPATEFGMETDVMEVKPLLTYPGKALVNIVQLAERNDFWGADLLNINFPAQASARLRFVQPMKREMIDYFNFDVLVDDERHTYGNKMYLSKEVGKNLDIDADAVAAGYITVVPWLSNLYTTHALLDLVGKEYDLIDK